LTVGSTIFPVTPGVVGDLRAQGQVRGPWQTARVDASAVGNIGTPAIRRQEIDISVNAIGFPRSESGNFRARGRFDNAPLSLDGELTRVQGGLKATVQRGTWKSLAQVATSRYSERQYRRQCDAAAGPV
jgi:hypothetical protein